MGERMDVDVSLDDYIQEKHIHRPRASNNAGSPSKNGVNNRGARNGNFRSSNRGGGGGFRPRGGINKPYQQNNFRRRNNDGGSGYVDMDGDSDPQTLALQQSMVPVQPGSIRMYIKNLDRNVNDDDIRDLFAEFGPIMHLNVNYDKMGRSLGSAEIVFMNHQDALRAKQKYDNVPLDGLPMKISVDGGTNNGSVAQRLGNRNNFRGGGGGGGNFVNRNNGLSNGGFRQFNNRRGGGGNNRQNSGGGNRQQRNQRQEPMSAEALDAELDAYKTAST